MLWALQPRYIVYFNGNVRNNDREITAGEFNEKRNFLETVRSIHAGAAPTRLFSIHNYKFVQSHEAKRDAVCNWLGCWKKVHLAHGKCNAVKFAVWVTEESAAKLIWSSAILTPIYDWTRVLMPDFFSHFWWKLGMEQNVYLRPEQKYSAFLREVFPPFSIDIHISNALFLELCTLWLGENTTAQCNGDRFSKTIFSRFPQLKKNAYSTCWNIE